MEGTLRNSTQFVLGSRTHRDALGTVARLHSALGSRRRALATCFAVAPERGRHATAGLGQGDPPASGPRSKWSRYTGFRPDYPPPWEPRGEPQRAPARADVG